MRRWGLFPIRRMPGVLSVACMPVVPLKDIVDRALADRYGVAAINILNELTLEAVLQAAVDERSPVIVQTSVATVRTIGAEVLFGLWRGMTAGIEVPVSLHLDHCPDRAVISECLALGWNSVLFDASALPVAENQRQTIEVVAEAHSYGAHVEGEIEAIAGIEDGHGPTVDTERQSLQVCLEFIERTGVDVFAPALGNAHGVYRTPPKLDAQRVSDLVDRTGVPLALHGGSGLSGTDFRELIGRGCAKVNISTALKMRFMQANLGFLRSAEVRDVWDPLALFRHVGIEVREMAAEHLRLFGSPGKAW